MPARAHHPTRSLLAVILGVLLACAPGAFGAGGTERTYRVGDPAQPRLQTVVSIDAGEMSVADRATLRIDADAPADCDITFPPFDAAIDGWRIVEVTRAESFSGSPARRHASMKVVLEPFLPGEKVIPQLTISVRSPGRSAAPVEITTDPLTVRVLGALDPKAAPAPPTPREVRTVTLPESPERRFAIGAAIVGGVLVLALLAYSARALAKRSTRPPDPSAIAIAALAQLTDAMDSNAPARAPLPALVSQHFRTVLGRSLGEPAHDRTLAELRTRVAHRAGLPEHTRSGVLDLLTRLEAAAYAPPGAPRGGAPQLAGDALTLARALHASSGEPR